MGLLESPRARNLQPWSPIEQLPRLNVNPLLVLEQTDAKYGLAAGPSLGRRDTRWWSLGKQNNR